jgi:hypothetical protein
LSRVPGNRHRPSTLTALKNFIRDRGLTVVGEPVFARYDPPFMPWFLRRNEIQIEVERPVTR